MTKSTVAEGPVRPVDIAVRYLAGDETAFVHGTTLDVDGGLLAARLG